MGKLIDGQVLANGQVLAHGQFLAHGSWLMAEAGPGPRPASGGAGPRGSRCGGPAPPGAGPSPGLASAMRSEQELAH